jgi:hypothetical protein
MNVPDKIMDWLLNSAPWTHYMTRKHLLSERMDGKTTTSCIRHILADKHISRLINETSDYFPVLATRHTDSKLSHYKLRMLSDFGLKKEHGLQDQIKLVKKKRNNGCYAIRQLLPIKHSDSANEWNALPCDNPLILYILLSMGDHDEQTAKQVEHLKLQWETPVGWFCHLPFVESQFKREKIGCPMAAIMALEVFSLDEKTKESKYARNAFQAVAHHFNLGKSIYFFGRGKKFFTFKYPFIWYNSLYMADVLTRFEFTKKHDAVIQLMDWIKKGCDDEGRYKPNSIFLEYRDWDFGNKKEPSPWITFLCYRIQKQYDRT